MRAEKIKMKSGCIHSNNLEEIDMIYVTGCQEEDFFSKAILYDFLKTHPGSIQVNIYPYPDLQPMLSINGEKYVRSKPDMTGLDNLLKLPRY